MTGILNSLLALPLGASIGKKRLFFAARASNARVPGMCRFWDIPRAVEGATPLLT
jgi:hypothetical protein